MAKGTRRVDRPQQDRAALFDRQPPASVAAEQCLLGSILLNPTVCDEVASIVLEKDFYDDAHRTLFRHMMGMYNDGKKVDVHLLTERLKSEAVLEQVGGVVYLARLAEMVPHAAHAVDYARTISDRGARRELIDISTDILHHAYDSPAETRELINAAEARIFSIIDDRGSSSLKEMPAMLMAALKRMDARIDGEHAFAGASSGFIDLDQMLGGLHPGELIVLAARPGMGKTALALNIAKTVAIDEHQPVLFVSLEMSSNELIDRLLCTIAEVNGHHLRNGTLSKKDRERLVHMVSTISKAPFFVDDSHSRSVLDIAAGARRVKRANNGQLALLVIDYLQLIEPENARDPRQEQVAKITRRLKGLARELEIPVLCLAQLNRQIEATKDNRPRLAHLRESGAIEQDADVVLFVHREEYFETDEGERQNLEGKAELIVAKQRNGPTGCVPVLWQKSYMRFLNMARHEYDALEAPPDTGGW
jgi:replicative DNA helicase